jgi:hypothetical protein
VPAAIVPGLNEQSFARPTVLVPPEFADWVRASDGRRTRAGELREYVYSVNVTVPPRATPGIRRFPLVVKYEDTTRQVEIGATRVTVLTGWQYHPLWRWLLVALAVLILLWWVRRARRSSSRLLRNGLLGRLLLRLLALALLGSVMYVAWRYLEGAEQLFDLL